MCRGRFFNGLWQKTHVSTLHEDHSVAGWPNTLDHLGKHRTGQTLIDNLTQTHHMERKLRKLPGLDSAIHGRANTDENRVEIGSETKEMQVRRQFPMT